MTLNYINYYVIQILYSTQLLQMINVKYLFLSYIYTQFWLPHYKIHIIIH